MPTELKVDDNGNQQPVAQSQHPHLSWKGVDDADQYLVLVSSDPAGEQAEWSGRTHEEDIRINSSARPLSPGLHYWRVVPMNDQALPLKDRQTSTGAFTVHP